MTDIEFMYFLLKNKNSLMCIDEDKNDYDKTNYVNS